MKDFFFKLFFNNDPATGYLPDLFGLEVSKSGAVSSVYPFWILPAIAFALAILAYFVGSINFALIISKLVYHDDIRKHGSHNAGTTNMKRTFGMKAAVLTLIGDLLKGVVVVLIPLFLISKSAAYLAGFCCVLGHCFPAYFKFRGGKGVATAFAIITALDPLVGLLLLVIFVLIVLGTKYISVGSIMGALLFPVLLDRLTRFLSNDETPPTALMSVCALLMTILIILMHHANIKRLMEGTENKFSLKKKTADGESGDKTSRSSGKKHPRSLHRIDEESDDDFGDDN